MTKFWEKVEKCDHKNLSPDYCETLYCSTPYCNSYETHCLDCGVFITQCGCGCENGMSGWPDKRYRKLWGTNDK
jgi:hypothetical protein